MRRIALVSLLCLAVAGTAKGEDSVTPLHEAALVGHPAAIEALLAGGADINAKAVSEDRYTKGSLAKTLLRAVGIVFIEDNEVWTPLYAAYRGMKTAEGETARFQEAIELLKAHGAR